ncbi:MAG: S-layer homology domain-containing protein [Candidatus Microthrix sp.]|nr:S-layer homology domain-containing protein [Candidatus Microthrix sp.]
MAVGWLVGAGITSGTSPGTYSPSQPVTRAQMAVFLWRAAGGPTR